MSKARRGFINVGAAVSAALSLAACQHIGPAIQPAACIAAVAYKDSLGPDADYRIRAAAAATAAAACSP